MAHSWTTQPATRTCSNCGATQTRKGKSWSPRAHTCVVDGKGQPPRTQRAVLAALEGGPLHRNEIAERCGKRVEAVASALTKLHQAGKVRRGSGKWELVREAEC